MKKNSSLKQYLLLINFIICIIIFIAGLWPFNFNPENSVTWLRDKNGIIINNSSIVYEAENNLNKKLSHSINKDEFTIEIFLKPYSEPQGIIAFFLCFYNSKAPEILTVAQWKSFLIIRKRLSEASYTKYSERGIPNALIAHQKIFLAITSEKKGTAVYINGNKKGFFPHYHLESGINSSLILGNSPSGKTSWTGEIYGLAFYNYALEQKRIEQHNSLWKKFHNIPLHNERKLAAFYPMHEKKGSLIHNIVSNSGHLIIPNNFHALKKEVLSPPWKGFLRNKYFFYDIIINIAGFIPLGFFLIAYFSAGSRFTLHSKRPIYISIIIGFIISISIELMQVYLPTRNSSITDLCCNVIGTCSGVFLFFIIYKRIYYIRNIINTNKLHQ